MKLIVLPPGRLPGFFAFLKSTAVPALSESLRLDLPTNSPAYSKKMSVIIDVVKPVFLNVKATVPEGVVTSTVNGLLTLVYPPVVIRLKPKT